MTSFTSTNSPNVLQGQFFNFNTTQLPPGLQEQSASKAKKKLVLKKDAQEFKIPSSIDSRSQFIVTQNERSESKKRLPACRNACDTAYTGINSGRDVDQKAGHEISNDENGLKNYLQTMEKLSAQVKQIFAC
jgi:hypothetical protein